MIRNAANYPLFQIGGDTPDVSGALRGWFQNMTFTPLTKTVSGFIVTETANPINFQGVIMPFTERKLLLKPEGQRAWSWFDLYADPVLTLQTDDVVLWLGRQTRVMDRKNYLLYGFVNYHLVQDFTGEPAGL